MLTDALRIKDYNEVIMSRTHPVLFDSGNPFIFTQTVLLSDQTFKILSDQENFQELCRERPFIDVFFKNQIEHTLNNLTKFKDNDHTLNNVGLVFLNQGNFEEAAKYFNKAIQLNPKYYPALANLAKLYLKQNKLHDATNIYEKLRDQFPTDSKVLLNLAHVYFKQREIDKAKALLVNVLKLDDKNASAYNNLGVIYIVQLDYNKAISFLRKALKINNRFANAYNNMGICYAMRKNHKKAINFFQAAILVNKNFAAAFKNLGNTYIETEEYGKAYSVINKFLENNNPDSESYDILTFALFKLKKHEQALKLLKQAIIQPAVLQNKEEQSRLYNNIGVLYDHIGNFTEADKNFTQSISIFDNNPIAIQNVINLNLRKYNTSKASKFIDKGRSQFPNNSDLLGLEGYYYYLVKDYSHACEVLKKALAINPKAASSYLLLNHILTDVYENYSEAVIVAQQGLQVNPKNIKLINNLAYTLLMSDKTKEARAILDNIEEQDDVFLTATRGLLLLKENNIHEGERFYNRAALLAREDTELYKQVKQKKYIELAKYYLNANNQNKAVSLLTKALSIHPKNDIYRSHLERLAKNL
jgi:superkiller protein 3